MSSATNAPIYYDPPPPRHRMRRCFMTGKQCIFCDSTPTLDVSGVPVFMAMPFRPNLSTSFSWSLKPFLNSAIKGESMRKVDIMRADDYPHIGAITCEKICRPIQDAHLVVVDVTLPNANVMYELGLAIGLGKGILFVKNQQPIQPNDNDFSANLKKYLTGSTSNEKLDFLEYPGVGYLDGAMIDLKTKVAQFDFPARAVTEFKVVGLAQKAATITEPGDVTVDFASIVDGAIGVALGTILNPGEKDDPQAGRVLKAAGVGKASDARGLAKGQKSRRYVALHNEGNYTTFKEVREEIDNAFCCVIDLAKESPAAYLWLGYCHARGINVIPIYRQTESDDTESVLFRPCPRYDDSEAVDQQSANRPGNKSGSHTGDPSRVLAFDIRALWYIDFLHKKTEDLAGLLKSVLSELIVRDLPRLERNRFWDRLTKTREIHIFTGAVHSTHEKREMVGDWDQRTVSELVRYLSSTNETVTPNLAPPIYAPEYCARRTEYVPDGASPELPVEFVDAYIAQVKKTLMDKNCIVVASADVNALTEILLGFAYRPQARNRRLFSADGDVPVTEDTVIALKPASKDEVQRKVAEGFYPAHRAYSRSAREGEGLGSGYRGFKIGAAGLVKTRYFTSDDRLPDLDGKLERLRGATEGVRGGPTRNESERSAEGFLLPSHLVIMKNPFVSNAVLNQGHSPLIVILNGVSGPGTYALAELLTGGEPLAMRADSSPEASKTHLRIDKAAEAEKLLKKVNTLLSKMDSENKRAVQGIVWVAISKRPQESELSTSQPDHGVDLYDERIVHSWDWCPNANGEMDNVLEDDEQVVVAKDDNPWMF